MESYHSKNELSFIQLLLHHSFTSFFHLESIAYRCCTFTEEKIPCTSHNAIHPIQCSALVVTWIVRDEKYLNCEIRMSSVKLRYFLSPWTIHETTSAENCIGRIALWEVLGIFSSFTAGYKHTKIMFYSLGCRQNKGHQSYRKMWTI